MFSGPFKYETQQNGYYGSGPAGWRGRSLRFCGW